MLRSKFKNWVAPGYFYQQSGKLVPYIAVLAILTLVYGLINGLWFAPLDYQQKQAVKLIYLHVPCALLSLSIYTIIGVMSVIYLIWHIKIADVIAQVSAPFGATMTALALISGSFWGKPMWGTWWVWDARLTSELILLFLYFGYIGLRNAIQQQQIAAKVCAILAVVGLIDIPIVHFSVEWWHTLHQGATISKFAKPSMHPDMLYPLLSSLLGFYLVYVCIVIIKARAELIWRERKSAWVAEILLGAKHE